MEFGRIHGKASVAGPKVEGVISNLLFCAVLEAVNFENIGLIL